MSNEAESGSSGPSPTNSRKIARVACFEVLYSVAVADTPLDEAIETVRARRPLLEDADQYFTRVTDGVIKYQSELDDTISNRLASGWSIRRCAITDLVALRIATYELFYMPGIPPKVSITQAVNIAKMYGSAESSRFVNGVLGSVLKDSPKVNWDPSQEEKRTDDFDTILDEEREQEIEIIEGSTEHEEMLHAGSWVIRKEE